MQGLTGKKGVSRESLEEGDPAGFDLPKTPHLQGEPKLGSVRAGEELAGSPILSLFNNPGSPGIAIFGFAFANIAREHRPDGAQGRGAELGVDIVQEVDRPRPRGGE